MTLAKKQSGIYIDDSVLDDLVSTDGIIFDCDGVLIDITKSYDLAIDKTVQYVLKNFSQIKDNIRVDSKIIDGFKSSGGFNDEVDLTYAAILSLTAAKKLNKDQHEFILDVISNADSSGILSIEKHLESFVDLSDIKNKLSYPGTRNDNLLYNIFDQIFYGPELYSKLFKHKSQFSEDGLIDNDVVILNLQLIQKLKSKFGKNIAIVSGRGLESIRYSLESLLGEFDLKNSAFLEDEPRELAKPNPESLIRSINEMNCKCCIYVGDSMEDFIMAKKATEQGCKVIFCGIIGTSKNPQEKLKLFENSGAMLVLESIHLLPKVLNLE
ncbi:MAG: HAD-IA family hydrolase [Nitrosarchaeum sp.]|jgi:phosphoglycolate phosphatase-like HAD superfamily hydrolase|uniref:HAD family hydrolase n=1 Tax=Nitrosarchaeum sp. TaxID=2026886 RepID=UPI002DF0D52E|nr:HAD-IA family hydrolase [Nitrosarchaeum sp.]MEC4849336.1 HAD-IA family hydrolase [Nitrosarchaeum sp.]